MDITDRIAGNPELLALARAEMVKEATAPARAAGQLRQLPSLKSVAFFGAGAGAASLMQEELTDAYRRGKAKLFKGHNFKKMMEVNPDLERLDKKQVNLAFNTINRFAPDFAADPLVSGTWVRQIAGYGEGVDPVSAGRLVDSAAKMKQLKAPATDAKSNAFLNAMTDMREVQKSEALSGKAQGAMVGEYARSMDRPKKPSLSKRPYDPRNKKPKTASARLIRIALDR